jgi:hypothetical protein
MSGDLDLEQRYRRVLRLLPGYYRDKWEEDMVAAFLDGWLTGDPDEDSVTMEYDRPTRPESPAWPAWPPGCTWAARALRAATSPGGRRCGRGARRAAGARGLGPGPGRCSPGAAT